MAPGPSKCVSFLHDVPQDERVALRQLPDPPLIFAGQVLGEAVVVEDAVHGSAVEWLHLDAASRLSQGCRDLGWKLREVVRSASEHDQNSLGDVPWEFVQELPAWVESGNMVEAIDQDHCLDAGLPPLLVRGLQLAL